MILRKLKLEDEEQMINWMHDPFVVKDMGTNFAEKTKDDCIRFITESWNDASNMHYAIEDNGRYMGTVSLKNIEDDKAEFAITICREAMGTGLSHMAMVEMLRIAFEEKKLKKIYWYVNTTNKRALKFYDKHGYRRVKCEDIPIKTDRDYVWYLVESTFS